MKEGIEDATDRVVENFHIVVEAVTDDKMEEEPTQPATQLMMDPRRLGQHSSGLDDDDLPDIFCILHPASMSACRVAALIAEDAPQHTISVSGVELKVRDGRLNNSHVSRDEPGTFELATQGIVSHDIALRLSSKLKDPLYGFQFGRNPLRCDFILGRGDTDGARRISNVHFRIYINEHGVIMLEDQSTNGTLVDGILLRAKNKENGKYRHSLEQGSLITLVMTPPDEDIKFVVRVPRREGDFEDQYDMNLRGYFSRLRTIYDAREAQRADVAGQNATVEKEVIGPPDLFGPPGVCTNSLSIVETRRHFKEWKGGIKYNKLHTVGKGAFATVYMVSSKFDGSTFAAKELEKRRFMKNGIVDQKVDTEMNIMRKIKHPHIVQYIEHFDWEEYLYLIMEFVPGGDLGALVAFRGHLPEPMVNSIADQMLSALDYLHSKNITHRDVKPDNILIQSMEPTMVKLTDFGLSKVVDSEDTFMRTFCGTLLYCAPEVYSEYREYDKDSGMRTKRSRGKENLPPQRYSHGVDVYSLGGVLFFALCGNPPYPAKSGTSYQELLNEIMTKALDVRPLQRVGVSENAIRFVKSMLHIRPELRPGIGLLQTSPWLTGESYSVGQDDDDETDYCGGMDGAVGGESVEQGASQLSLRDDDTIGSQIEYFDEIDIDDEVVQLVRATPSEPEIPNSQSSVNESFAFLRNPQDKSRLFGEINASMIGSSGVIPRRHLNLPLSQSFQDHDGYTTTTSPEHSTGQIPIIMHAPINGGFYSTEPQQAVGADRRDTITPSTDEIPAVSAPQHSISMGPVHVPSLTGAESMVGNLQMNSPSPVPLSPPPMVLLAAPSHLNQSSTNLNESTRRPRDEEDQDTSCPDTKRRKSERQIEITLSKTTFWSSKDKSTWHQNYPNMTLSEYNEAERIAISRGETFTHGQKYFDEIVAGYVHQLSAVPEGKPRAESEPVVEQGRRAMLKRDSRTMEELQRLDAELPSTECPIQDGVSLNGCVALDNDETLPETQIDTDLPVVDAIVKPSQVLLATLKTTPDSVVKISINITDPFMTWGRGHSNTIEYSDKKDVRVPKYGLKIVLIKRPSGDAFYVSTKATLGITVNDVVLKSYDAKNPQNPWKFWGELKTGDLITVWRLKSDQFIKLQFESFVSNSKEPRQEAFKIESLDIGKQLDNIVGK